MLCFRNYKFIPILGSLILLGIESEALPAKQNDKGKSVSKKVFEDAHVFITLSSEARIENGQIHDTEIELNWYNFAQSPGDWVGLFDSDPAASLVTPGPSEALVSVEVNDAASAARGYHKTDIRFGRPNITAESLGDNCLGYWIAYVQNETLAARNCFRKYPTWMNDLQSIIGDKPLSNWMIPGTHDAGAIREYDAGSENPALRYNVCQEEEHYRQFVHGIRYVDTRVSYYPDTEEKFWINHGSTRYRPLKTLFDAIKRFVDETREIIFMDYHEFAVGFDEDLSIHDLLLQFVVAEMGDYLVSKSQVPANPTGNDLWAVNRTVILTYQKEDVMEANDFLWPYLIHGWGDKNAVEPLEKYFQDEAFPQYGCKGIWWSAQAEMTPTALDHILYPLRGLRGYAQMVNIPLSYWWQREDWYSRSMIVSTDFFLGSNIIEMSVWANKNNAVCPDSSK